LKQICLVAIVGGFVSRMFLLHGFHNVLGAIVFLPCQSDSLAMGALLAVLVREREQLVATLAWPLALIGAAIWLATLLDGNSTLTVGVSGFAMMSLGALALCLYHPISKWFSNPILRAFGKYSYGIYVLHVIILSFVLPLREKFGTILFVLFFIPLAFCAGWLSWHLFEAHFLKLKRFFPMSSNRTWTPRLHFNQKKETMPVVQAV
jgi:peptidoglycan/LPS O-acetylase OafA/YrhL